MTTLQARPYLGEADIRPMVDLLEAIDANDHTDEAFSEEQIRNMIEGPALAQGRNVQLWQAADGSLQAAGVLWMPQASSMPVTGSLHIYVHPEARGADNLMEHEVLQWAEAHLREIAASRGGRSQLTTRIRDDQASLKALLAKTDFELVRQFWIMDRSLHEPLPEAVFPTGFSVRTLAGPEEVEAWTAMFNEAFADHWDHHDLQVERRKIWMTEQWYRPDLDLVGIGPDGTMAAFCFCEINAERNRRSGRQEGWIDDLGTRQAFRRSGLGRAMLVSGMQRLRDAGMDSALLNVDSENATGAARLYATVGFRPRDVFVNYRKELGAATI